MELGILKTSEFRDGKHVTVEVPYCTPKKSTLLTGVKGCGKSTALLKFALEDIYAGESVVVIDPRGEVVAELLDHIPAARQPDVIFINPAEQEFALNIFHGVRNKPLFTSTVLDTLRGLWGFEEASTPDFDQYVRYGIRTLLEVPNTNLLSLWLLLTDEEYRDGVLKTIKDPVLKNFWQNFEPLPPKDKRQETKSTLNKLSSFTLDPLVRNCLGQQKNHLVFENKIVLLSLSDAELGEDNARLMGALVLALLYLEGVQRTKTTLYIDGAESFMTPILGKILKGARNIPAILAVQQLDQLKHFKKDWGPSILGAVGQVISFRTSMKDAETLNPLFLLNGKQGPPELYNLDREEFKAWVAVDGQRQDLYTTPHQYSRTNQARKIKARCKSQYTQPRATIEKKIKEMFQ